MKNRNKTGCIIMASGASRRFGENKLTAKLAGIPMINYILDTTENLFHRRIVVTRHEDIYNICSEKNILSVLHDFPCQNDTIRIGLEHIGPHIDNCIFCPADQPLISQETLIRMLIQSDKEPLSILRPSYGDTVGTPTLFPSWAFHSLMNLPRDKGGNVVISANLTKVSLIPVRMPYELLDVDTKDDLEKLSSIIKEYNLFL